MICVNCVFVFYVWLSKRVCGTGNALLFGQDIGKVWRSQRLLWDAVKHRYHCQSPEPPQQTPSHMRVCRDAFQCQGAGVNQSATDSLRTPEEKAE